MNFLAHLALAGPSDASRIGNLLGDFEKGTPPTLRLKLRDDVVDGIVMHRHIDAFTDSHPLFLRCKQLLRPEHRRFSGIVIDIFFDHLLTHHWSQFHPGTVPDFIAEIYQCFDRNPELLGQSLGPLVPRIKAENWLAAYRTEAGLALTLSRVAKRSPRLQALTETLPSFVATKAEFENLFLQFYPEVRAYAASQLGRELAPPPSFP